MGMVSNKLLVCLGICVYKNDNSKNNQFKNLKLNIYVNNKILELLNTGLSNSRSVNMKIQTVST